jgi:hypothetical protein
VTLVSVPVNEAAVAQVFGGVLNDGKGGKQVGDVTSNARGSGARYNAGKAPVDLLLWRDVAEMLPADTDEHSDVVEAMAALGVYQEDRDASALDAIIACLYSSRTLAMRDASRVLAHGAKKYAAWNWAKGMAWSVPLACAGRHLLAIYDGVETDPESNCPHRAHVVCNVLMLAAFARFYKEGDDLPRVGGQSPGVQAMIAAGEKARELQDQMRAEWSTATADSDFRKRVGLA